MNIAELAPPGGGPRTTRYGTDWKAFGVVNQGDESIDVEYQLNVGRQIRVAFRPQYAGSYEAQVTVVRKASGTLCKPPPVLTVAGKT